MSDAAMCCGVALGVLAASALAAAPSRSCRGETWRPLPQRQGGTEKDWGGGGGGNGCCFQGLMNWAIIGPLRKSQHQLLDNILAASS